MKTNKLTNIVLIGMPGVGKSTFGVLLAKMAAMAFIDTDLLLQSEYGASLQAQLDDLGYEALRARETQVLLNLDYSNTVIATGGSAVYSQAGMQHLAKKGTVVYLSANESTLAARIHNMGSRGIAKSPEQSFSDVYQERVPLYKRYAQITVSTENTAAIEVIAEQLILQLQDLCQTESL